MTFRPFSAADLKTLRRRWLAGDVLDDIAAELKRRPYNVSHKAREMGLPPRARGRKRTEHSTQRHGRGGAPIADHPNAMKAETGSQALRWTHAMTDLRFDDDPKARRPEPMLRGGPGSARSLTGCAALMAAGQ